MGRHPYTYAADLIRSWAGYNKFGTVLSRSSASQVIGGFAEVLGLTKEELSEKLSWYYQEHQQEISDNSIEKLKREFPNTVGSLLLDNQDDYKGVRGHIKEIIELHGKGSNKYRVRVVDEMPEEDDYKGADHD
jgi:hypothetical protein